MQLGMIGLGRMGANMVRRLMRDGHQCVVYDVYPEAVQGLVKEGAVGAKSLDDFAKKLTKPRAAWIMVPAAAVDKTLADLSVRLEKGDIIIDGGNSYYIDDIRRAKQLQEKGIHYVDVGTSGGVWGLERGFCHMIGGEKKIVQHLDPIFASLAPTIDSAPRTPGREKKKGGTAEHGEVKGELPLDGGGAETMLRRIGQAGVDVDALAAELQVKGRDAFVASFDSLLARVATKMQALRAA